jgi:hypothetical protein
MSSDIHVIRKIIKHIIYYKSFVWIPGRKGIINSGICWGETLAESGNLCGEVSANL